MQPITSRDFLKAARQRLMAAETLLTAKLTLDAQYIGGYTVECALKALILQNSPIGNRAYIAKRITSGATMHRPDVLFGELRNLGVIAPGAITKRMRRFAWTTDLRYETRRRDTGETRAFLLTAKSVLEWVEALLQ